MIPKFLGGTYQLFYLKGRKDWNAPAFTPLATLSFRMYDLPADES